MAAAATLEGLGARPLRFIEAGVDGWRDASALARTLAADPPDAVLCYDDKLALGLLDALRSTEPRSCRTTWPWRASTGSRPRASRGRG